VYKKFLLIISLIFLQAHGADDSLKTDSNQTILKQIIGGSVIGFEIVGIPLADWYLNRHKPININNMSLSFRDAEPYIQDELWHFVAAASTNQFNYLILSECFDLDNSLLASIIISSIFWTGLEFLDGIAGSGFSFRDELGNISGILYSTIKTIYPDFPIYIRLGVHDWGLLSKTLDKMNIRKLFREKYCFMKVDILFMAKNQIYGGLSISNTTNKHDRIGITAGYDLLKEMTEVQDARWNKLLNFITNYFTLSINFTVWING
jgi:hypothetical protein